MDYRGFKFTTNKEIECIVVSDTFNDKYVIVGIINCKLIASDSYNNVEKLINTVTEKF